MIRAIVKQERKWTLDDETLSKAKEEVKRKKEERNKEKKFNILNVSDEATIRQIALASEKGASSWLSSLPLEDCGFVLNKQEFIDAMALRYNKPIKGTSKTCVCGVLNDMDHSLVCKRGGFISLRHDRMRDTTASLIISKVCKDTVTEPLLLPITGEKLT